MKIILWLLCFLAFSLLVALITKVRFRITAKSNVRLDLEVLFLKFPVFPEKEKRPNPRRFTRRGLEKQIIRERKKAEKKKKKKDAKAAKKQAKAQAKEAARAAGKQEKKMSVIEMIELVTLLIRTLLTNLSRRLKIDVKRLNVVVATGDAAKTAVLYGTVSAAVAALTELLANATKTKLPSAENGGVFADFVGESSKLDIEIVLSMRVYQVFFTLVSLAYNYLKKQFFKTKG